MILKIVPRQFVYCSSSLFVIIPYRAEPEYTLPSQTV